MKTYTKQEAQAEIDRLMNSDQYSKANGFWMVHGFGLPRPKVKHG